MRRCIALLALLWQNAISLRPTHDDTTEAEPHRDEVGAQTQSLVQQQVEDPRFHVSEEAKEKIMKVVEQLNEDAPEKLWVHVDFANRTGWEYSGINRFSPSGPEPPGPLQALVSHLLFRHGLALAYASSPRWFPLWKQFMEDPERQPREGESRAAWAMNALASFSIHFAEDLEGIGLPGLRQLHEMDNLWAYNDPLEQSALLKRAWPGGMDKADPDDICLFQAGRAHRVSEAAVLLQLQGTDVEDPFTDFLHYTEEVSRLNLKDLKTFSMYEVYTEVKAEGLEELVEDSLKLVEYTGRKKTADIRGQIKFESGYTPDFEVRLTDVEYSKLPQSESERMEAMAEIVRKRMRVWSTRYAEIVEHYREAFWANEMLHFLIKLPAVQEEARRLGSRFS